MEVILVLANTMPYASKNEKLVNRALLGRPSMQTLAILFKFRLVLLMTVLPKRSVKHTMMQTGEVGPRQVMQRDHQGVLRTVHGRIGIHILIPTIVQPITSASKKQRLVTYAQLKPIARRTAANVSAVLMAPAASQADVAPTVKLVNMLWALGAPTAMQDSIKTKMELPSAKVARLEVAPTLVQMH